MNLEQNAENGFLRRRSLSFLPGSRYVLYFDLQNMEQTTKICVEKCPTNDLRSLSDIKKFYEETGVNLCRYVMESKASCLACLVLTLWSSLVTTTTLT